MQLSQKFTKRAHKNGIVKGEWNFIQYLFYLFLGETHVSTSVRFDSFIFLSKNNLLPHLHIVVTQ